MSRGEERGNAGPKTDDSPALRRSRLISEVGAYLELMDEWGLNCLFSPAKPGSKTQPTSSPVVEFSSPAAPAPPRPEKIKAYSPLPAAPAPEPKFGRSHEPRSPSPVSSAPKSPPLPRESPKSLGSLSWLRGLTDLSDLNQNLGRCLSCPLSRLGRAKIPGRGPRGAPIMFVTEPVGLDSLERDERSLSPEEQLLEKIVTSGLKFELSQCYVTHIVKCPLPDPERGSLQTLKSCAQITLREIDLASPGLVLALGLWPSQALSGNFSPLGLLKSKRQTVGAAKIALRMNYGLADLVRMPELKRDFWNDLKSYRAEGLF